MWRLLGFLSICTAAGLAQDAAVFRSQTRLVRVPVIATRDGQPVRDLKAEDFKLLDNGKERPIAVFSMEEQRAVAGSASPATPNTFSNRLEEKQSTPVGVTLMVLAGIPTQAKVELLEFIRDLKKDDHLGIYAFWEGYVNVLHDYSTDCSQLLARAQSIYGKEAFDLKTVIDKLFPNRAKAGAPLIRLHEGISEVEDAYLINFRGLKAIARHVAAIPGRKNLIWIGPGFSTNYGKLAQNKQRALVRGGNFMVEEAFAAFDALNSANVAIYAVDPRGLMTANAFTAAQRLNDDRILGGLLRKIATERANVPLEGLQEMAQQTGGRVYANRNDIQVALRQAADDGRVSYELGFYPPEKDWDGRQHKLEVKANRARDLAGTPGRVRRGGYRYRTWMEGRRVRPLRRDGASIQGGGATGGRQPIRTYVEGSRGFARSHFEGRTLDGNARYAFRAARRCGDREQQNRQLHD